MKVLVLNGPNLQLLGRRKVEVYGVVPLPEIEARLRAVASELGVEIGFLQSNHEGVLVDAIAQALADGVVSPERCCQRSKRIEVYRNGELVDRLVGNMPKANIAQKLDSLL